MSIQNYVENFCCCNKKLNHGELWVLQDIKGYTARKLYKAHCPICDDDVVLYIHKNISKNEFYPEILKGINAVKMLYKEKKRRLQVFPNVETDNLFGWIYGINTQIKTRTGTISQTRQYASDFKGKKELVKTIYAAK